MVEAAIFREEFLEVEAVIITMVVESLLVVQLRVQHQLLLQVPGLTPKVIHHKRLPINKIPVVIRRITLDRFGQRTHPRIQMIVPIKLLGKEIFAQDLGKLLTSNQTFQIEERR